MRNVIWLKWNDLFVHFPQNSFEYRSIISETILIQNDRIIFIALSSCIVILCHNTRIFMALFLCKSNITAYQFFINVIVYKNENIINKKTVWCLRCFSFFFSFMSRKHIYHLKSD